MRNKNTNIRGRSLNAIKMISHTTRGILNVLSMVFYLSNRFTNPIMFDIILKNYLSSTLWHKFYEEILCTISLAIVLYV